MSNEFLEVLCEQQNRIIYSSERKIVVSAGPGSGKTYTIVKRITKELLENEETNVIVTSFTREASRQLEEKLKNEIDIKGSFIGTLDSLVMNEIIYPYKYRYLSIIKVNYKDLKIKYKMTERGSRVEELVKIGMNEVSRDELIYYYKKWINQLANGEYEISAIAYLVAVDMINKCSQLKNYLRAKYSSIYIDEAQDLNEFQHHFIDKLVKQCDMNIVLIGDKNQSIYKFRGSRPELFYNLSKKEGYTEYKITISVRCHTSILFFSNLIVGREVQNIQIDQNKVKINYEPNLSNVMKCNGNYLILFETNDLAITCFEFFTSKSLDVVYSKPIIIKDKEISDNYLNVIEDTLRFRYNVYNHNPRMLYSIEEYKEVLLNDFILKERDLKVIEDIAGSEFQYLKRICITLNIIIPKNILDSIEEQLKNPICKNHYIMQENINRIMTIHASKGLEAENVFVRLSSIPEEIDNEYRRKLFVAFSRAKSNLYISFKNKGAENSGIGRELEKNYSYINSLVKK